MLFLGLAGTAAALGLKPAWAAMPGDTTGLAAGPAPRAEPAVLTGPQAEPGGDDVEPVQYRDGPPRRHRRPRCWMEARQVRFRDRWGHWRVRTVERRVCR